MIGTGEAGAGGQSGRARALGAGEWLCLAATPTFAVMALLSGVLGGGQMATCSALPSASALTGMVPMYLLMSAFHASPWVKLFTDRRSSARPS